MCVEHCQHTEAHQALFYMLYCRCMLSRLRKRFACVHSLLVSLSSPILSHFVGLVSSHQSASTKAFMHYKKTNDKYKLSNRTCYAHPFSFQHNQASDMLMTTALSCQV